MAKKTSKKEEMKDLKETQKQNADAETKEKAEAKAEKERQEKIERAKKEIRKTQRGIWNNANRYMTILLSYTLADERDEEEVKKSPRPKGVIPLSEKYLTESQMKQLNRRAYNQYMNFTGSSHKSIGWIGLLGRPNTFNLKDMWEKRWVDFLNDKLKEIDVIDDNGKIVDQKTFDELVNDKLFIVPPYKRAIENVTITNDRKLGRTTDNTFTAVLNASNVNHEFVKNNKFNPFTSDDFKTEVENIVSKKENKEMKFEKDPFELNEFSV